MSDEQKTEGVPEGWRVIHIARKVQPGEFYLDHTATIQQNNLSDQTIYAFAVLERIPKPKQSVIVAEWDVWKGSGFTAPRARIGGIYRDCDRFRVEERDEPRNEEPKPKRHILMAEAEVPLDFRIEDGGAIVAYRSGTGVSLDIHRFNAEVFRIEERDA